MLRRSQLGLKAAAKAGELAPDGQAPAKAKRGRRPGAKAKAKAKAKASAKAKAAPKSAATKSSPSKSSKGNGKNRDDAGDGDASAPIEKKVKGKVKGKGKGKEKHNEQSKGKGKETSNEKKGKGKGKVDEPKEPVVPDSPEIPKDGVQQKCFARRRRPVSMYAGKKWDAVRQAFQHTVKPLLESYSAHEDLVLQGGCLVWILISKCTSGDVLFLSFCAGCLVWILISKYICDVFFFTGFCALSTCTSKYAKVFWNMFG